MKTFFRLLVACFLILGALQARSASIISATITVTNAPTTNHMTLTVNGDVRYWTNVVSIPATQVATNATINGCATNLWLHISGTPFTGPISVRMSAADKLILQAAIDQALTVTAATPGGPNWASVTYSTQTVSTLNTIRVPGSAETADVRANNFSLLTTAISDYSTNAFAHGATALQHFVNSSGTQDVSNKTFKGTTAFHGTLTNATALKVSTYYRSSASISTGGYNGLLFEASSGAQNFTIAPDASGRPSIYATDLTNHPTHAASFTANPENILTRHIASNSYGGLGWANTWTGTNSFAQITNTTIYGGSISNTTIVNSTISGVLNTVGISTLTNANLQKTASSTVGVITMNSVPFVHAMGVSNVFLGENAGNFTLTGDRNSAVGARAGISLTGGYENTLYGAGAGDDLTTGFYNVMIGRLAGDLTITGEEVVLIGYQAKGSSSSASRAVGIGKNIVVNSDGVSIGSSSSALHTNSIAIGAQASPSAAGVAAIGGAANWAVRVNVNAGRASSQRAWIGGTINVNSTAVGNVGAGEDNLMTFTLPADSLFVNGDRVVLRAAGTFAANGNNKRVKLKFGSATIYDSTAIAFNSGSWFLEAEIIRTSSTAQIANVKWTSSNSSLRADGLYSAPSESLGSGVSIFLTGEATADDDISQKSMTIEWHPNPSG